MFKKASESERSAPFKLTLTSEPSPSLDLRSSIVNLISTSSISSPATVLTAVIAVARVEISFGAFVISSQCEAC